MPESLVTPPVSPLDKIAPSPFAPPLTAQSSLHTIRSASPSSRESERESEEEKWKEHYGEHKMSTVLMAPTLASSLHTCPQFEDDLDRAERERDQQSEGAGGAQDPPGELREEFGDLGLEDRKGKRREGPTSMASPKPVGNQEKLSRASAESSHAASSDDNEKKGDESRAEVRRVDVQLDYGDVQVRKRDAWWKLW